MQRLRDESMLSIIGVSHGRRVKGTCQGRGSLNACGFIGSREKLKRPEKNRAEGGKAGMEKGAQSRRWGCRLGRGPAAGN